MNFSRRKAMQPLPPLPAVTVDFCFVDEFHDGGLCRVREAGEERGPHKRKTPPKRGSSRCVGGD
jgi:hypothetical protein